MRALWAEALQDLARIQKRATRAVKPFKLKQPPPPTERVEQNAVIRWWDSYARTRGLDPRLLFAIPNGAVLAGDKRQRGIQMAKLKQGGLRVGAMDLMLARPIEPFHGLFIEMKRIGAHASPDQVEMATLFRNQGYNVVIAEGSDEAVRAIKGYLG